ncbi:hypothetical protein K4749_05170 [Streptomyces sp. TRM72054]|uniref:hypothetical protein n=1 Tax=Streptomyces sp. TRM72054 TaxID=2870562 RepID=UPI001C8CC87A|nr:hypothetical protein [Streptomyces sp. TRM72054]MBX9392988.1 hypothetical protein [Streptomyces sp. TRM72054]
MTDQPSIGGDPPVRSGATGDGKPSPVRAAAVAAGIPPAPSGRPGCSSGQCAGRTGHWANTHFFHAYEQDGELIIDGHRRPADRLMADEARALLRAGRTARVTVGGNGDGCPEPLTLLVHVHASRPA